MTETPYLRSMEFVFRKIAAIREASSLKHQKEICLCAQISLEILSEGQKMLL